MPGPSIVAHSPLVSAALAWGAGVLTSLTPCIYPMIPITVAVIGGAATGGRPSRQRTVGLSVVYALGLALVYASMGLVAGLSGEMFGAVASSAWGQIVQGNLLLLFALAMLDLFPIALPRSWVERAAAIRGGTVLAVFLMGATSGLVAAPCSAPVMAGLLTWVSRTGSAGLGFLYLFSFSLGMTSLLILIGAGSGLAARLPKSGAWLLTVKRIFALLLLGAAEYYFLRAGAAF